MLRSAVRGTELECQDTEEEESSIRELYVEGYDGNLDEGVLEEMMRNYFKSCGEMTNIVFEKKNRRSCCTISIRGKKAEEEALKRSGSNAGGWNVVVSRAKPTKEDLERWGWSPEMEKRRTMFVEGYDTWLPRDEIEGKLRNYFSKCGVVESVMVPPGDGNGRCYSKAMLIIYGEDVVENVQKHCESDKDFEWDMRVVLVSPAASSMTSRGMHAGFTRKHPR